MQFSKTNSLRMGSPNLGAVSDVFMAVIDRFMSVSDRFMAVSDGYILNRTVEARDFDECI